MHTMTHHQNILVHNSLLLAIGDVLFMRLICVGEGSHNRALPAEICTCSDLTVQTYDCF